MTDDRCPECGTPRDPRRHNAVWAHMAELRWVGLMVAAA